MENRYSNFDANTMPVHLFVKSQKQAKKVSSQSEPTQIVPIQFRKGKRFKSVGMGHTYTL